MFRALFYELIRYKYLRLSEQLRLTAEKTAQIN